MEKDSASPWNPKRIKKKVRKMQGDFLRQIKAVDRLDRDWNADIRWTTSEIKCKVCKKRLEQNSFEIVAYCFSPKCKRTNQVHCPTCGASAKSWKWLTSVDGCKVRCRCGNEFFVLFKNHDPRVAYIKEKRRFEQATQGMYERLGPGGP